MAGEWEINMFCANCGQKISDSKEHMKLEHSDGGMNRYVYTCLQEQKRPEVEPPKPIDRYTVLLERFTHAGWDRNDGKAQVEYRVTVKDTVGRPYYPPMTYTSLKSALKGITRKTGTREWVIEREGGTPAKKDKDEGKSPILENKQEQNDKVIEMCQRLSREETILNALKKHLRWESSYQPGGSTQSTGMHQFKSDVKLADLAREIEEHMWNNLANSVKSTNEPSPESSTVSSPTSSSTSNTTKSLTTSEETPTKPKGEDAWKEWAKIQNEAHSVNTRKVNASKTTPPGSVSPADSTSSAPATQQIDAESKQEWLLSLQNPVKALREKGYCQHGFNWPCPICLDVAEKNTYFFRVKAPTMEWMTPPESISEVPNGPIRIVSEGFDIKHYYMTKDGWKQMPLEGPPFTTQPPNPLPTAIADRTVRFDHNGLYTVWVKDDGIGVTMVRGETSGRGKTFWANTLLGAATIATLCFTLYRVLRYY